MSDPLQGVEREPGLPHVAELLALDVDVSDDAVAEAEEPDAWLHGRRLDVEEVEGLGSTPDDVQQSGAET